jgi:hypothetical protein
LARNNVTLEKELGIPTVGFVSQGFHQDYWAAARAYGIVDLPQVNVPREFTSCSDEDVQNQAEAAVEDIIKALTTPLKTRAEKISGPLKTPEPPAGYPLYSSPRLFRLLSSEVRRTKCPTVRSGAVVPRLPNP